MLFIYLFIYRYYLLIYAFENFDVEIKLLTFFLSRQSGRFPKIYWIDQKKNQGSTHWNKVSHSKEQLFQKSSENHYKIYH